MLNTNFIGIYESILSVGSIMKSPLYYNLIHSIHPYTYMFMLEINLNDLDVEIQGY